MSTYWQTDNLLRTSELATNALAGGDLVMLLSNSGTVVNGDNARKFPDGKSRLDLAGYTWGQVVNPETSSSTGDRHMLPLVVVRRVDAATATFSSFMQSRTNKLELRVSAYRAGGDSSTQDTLPMFELQLDEAQVIAQYFHTGGVLKDLTEVLAFSFRRMTVRSWPQQATGARGGVRECVMSVGSNS